MAPNLPARKTSGGRRVAAARPGSARDSDLPILQAQEIELEDGTKIPVKIPPGMPSHQAQALLEYLRANPDAAKQVHSQAQQILKNPSMAAAFTGMQQSMQTPGLADRYKALKDDPELKHIFEDVVNNGPAAFQKYYEDVELMTKVSAKMREMQLAEGGATAAPPAAPTAPPSSLHEAAKRGHVAAVKQFLEQGVPVDSLNERGVTALGVAVGFNRTEVVGVLLAAGAQIELQDPAGNTVLHYAAGYGRKQVCEQLLAAGADVGAVNKAGQKPVDAARMNKEMQLVQLLEARSGVVSEEAGSQQSAATQ